jgi:hypothetical protein
MDDIIEPVIDYDFSKLYLGPPSTLAGGSYFTRIMYNNNKMLHLQTPKCLTKQGFIKSGKKLFVDLMFDNNDTVFINWIENLESKCQELIHNKGDAWFQTKLEKDDIETAFTSPFKIYKSGKYYLLRVNVKPNIKIYNETDEIIKLEDITISNYIISILEIQGIKFTSRNFQIEIELKQSMIVSPDPFLDECFIKKPIKKQQIDGNTNIVSFTPDRKADLSEFIKETAKELTTLGNVKPSIDLETTFNKSNNFELTELTELTEFNPSVDVETLDDKEDNDDDDDNDDDEDEEDNDDDHDNGNDEDDDHDNAVKNTRENAKQTTSGNDNIFLEVEELDFPEIEDPNVLKEIDLSSSLVNSLETITLKKPNQVYYEIYKQARDKAKEAKHVALAAYLEAKNIKNTYMLDDIDDSDNSDMEELNEYDNT